MRCFFQSSVFVFSDIQTPLQGLWFSIDALCDICFIIDILVKFRTRFLKHGVYITDISTLNYHHTREWTLFLDVVAVFPTDLFFIQSINPYLRLNRVLKVYRAVSVKISLTNCVLLWTGLRLTQGCPKSCLRRVSETISLATRILASNRKLKILTWRTYS